MTSRSAFTFGPLTAGLSLVLLGSVALTGIAVAGDRAQTHAEKQGISESNAAGRALARGKAALAIRHAEAAVAAQPQVAPYRVTLGQSYLKAGRFASARDAFGDALTLDGGNGKAALNYALAQIATGDWAGARKTLDAHAATIGTSDRGLAIALAGDPAAAVELLGAAARAPDADAKTRQNLALSLALAGRWREAQTVAAIDVAPADVSKRILEWSTFSRPKSAYDQVAALLGVTPAVDPGLPVALALNPARPATAVAEAAPIDTFMPGKVEVASAPEPVTSAPELGAVAANAPQPVGPTMGGVVFAARKEVVQAIPVSVARAAVSVAVARKDASYAAAKGGFYVQVGAFRNAGVARDAWGRVLRRYAAFHGHVPQGMNVTRDGSSFYRLSVGGFARADAVALCRGYRAKGGACFVRAGAGDQVALWARGNGRRAERG